MSKGGVMSEAQEFRQQKTAKQQEFLKKIADVCAAQGGICYVGDYAVIDTRLYKAVLR